MKQEQRNRTTNQTIWKWPLQEKFRFLKAILVGSWFALGSALLLIGGDDSVEIGFGSLAPLALNQTTIPLSGNDIEGGHV
jgi:hypothetical protein